MGFSCKAGLRDAETANIPFSTALTGALRRCSSLVWLATLHSERLALHPASTAKNGTLTISASLISALLAAISAASVVTPALALDAEAAQMLARQSGCFKCHAIDKKKDGPPYREVAAKYRGNAEAEAKLYHHVTAGEKVKFRDGSEDNHKIITSTDAAEIRNLIGWILSL